MLKTRVSLSENPTIKDVTAAWKKYLRLVHPDLTTDPTERRLRTEETQILNSIYDKYMKENGFSSSQREARKKAASE